MGILDGKVAIITGAGGGLGRAHALALAKEGASIVVNDLGGSVDGTGSGDTMADQVVAEIEAAGGKAVANHGNVTLAEDADAMVAAAVEADSSWTLRRYALSKLRANAGGQQSITMCIDDECATCDDGNAAAVIQAVAYDYDKPFFFQLTNSQIVQ